MDGRSFFLATDSPQPGQEPLGEPGWPGSDLERVQAQLILGARRALGAAGCALILVDGEWLVRKELPLPAGTLHLAEGQGATEWAHLVTPREGPGLVRQCIQHGRMINFSNLAGNQEFDAGCDAPIALDQAVQVQSMLIAPLVGQGGILGAIQVWKEADTNNPADTNSVLAKPGGPAAFDARDEQTLAWLSEMTSVILESLRQVQELKVAQADMQADHWELLNAQAILLALLANLPDSVYVIDRQFKLAAVSPSRARLVGPTGQPPQMLLGLPCYQALFGRQSPCPECRALQTMQTGKSTQRNEQRRVMSPNWGLTGLESGLEPDWQVMQGPQASAASPVEGAAAGPSALSTESGRAVESSEWEIFTYPVLDSRANDLPAMQVIVLERDISEKRHLESILTQSEKLAAIGQLAAGVAHEINNPLTAIIANAQILHRELPANSELQESIDLIARAGARATQMVRNLLDFARKEEYALKLTDLNDTLVRSLELVRHELVAHSARLEFDPDPNLPPILASQDHLQSVWLNLLLNAIDSLDKVPGEIKITTRKVGGDVLVAVSDNGKGIPPDRLSRIFEAFYTTKAPGRGTGLGLSVSHRIVKQHGGRIRVESQVGLGSKFTIIIPLS